MNFSLIVFRKSAFIFKNTLSQPFFLKEGFFFFLRNLFYNRIFYVCPNHPDFCKFGLRPEFIIPDNGSFTAISSDDNSIFQRYIFNDTNFSLYQELSSIFQEGRFNK